MLLDVSQTNARMLILKGKGMVEAELMSHVYSSNEAIWSLMQYWTSVSMGVLIGSHLSLAG
jgi:hypothetical protein